jgi:hypothetical protein
MEHSYTDASEFSAGQCLIPAEFSTIYNSDLHQYNPEENKWTEVTSAFSAPMPSGRCGMGFAAGGGRLMVFGGCTSTREYAGTHVFVPCICGVPEGLTWLMDCA